MKLRTKHLERAGIAGLEGQAVLESLAQTLRFEYGRQSVETGEKLFAKNFQPGLFPRDLMGVREGEASGLRS